MNYMPRLLIAACCDVTLMIYVPLRIVDYTSGGISPCSSYFVRSSLTFQAPLQVIVVDLIGDSMSSEKVSSTLLRKREAEAKGAGHATSGVGTQ